MTAPALTPDQQATVGKHVQLPDGRVALVCREDITGTPAFVRNRIVQLGNAGVLLRRGPIGQTLTDKGWVVSVSAYVLNTSPPPTGLLAGLPRWVRWATRGAAGALMLFGGAAVLGYWTGSTVASALVVPACGALAVAAGFGLLRVATLVATVCPGTHCGGCPDK